MAPLAVLQQWDPLSTMLVAGGILYVAGQTAVSIIRALKGNNQPTALDQQVAAALSALQARSQAHDAAINQVSGHVDSVAGQVGDIAKDFVPPQVVADMIKAQVVQYLAAIRAQQAARTAAAPAAPARAGAAGTASGTVDIVISPPAAAPDPAPSP